MKTKLFSKTIKPVFKIRHYFLIAIFAALTLSSCEKSEDDVPEIPQTPEPTTSSPSSPQITFTDADAVLIAIQTVSYNSVIGIPVETAIGVPVAIFPDGVDFKNVGKVTCEGTNLTRQENNAYVFTPSLLQPTGISYGDPIEWEVEGGNGFSGGTFSTPENFPGNVVIDAIVGETIDGQADYTLSSDGAITDADSIYYGVYGPNGGINHVVEGSISSYTFTADEMKSLGAGSGYIQIAAVNYVDREVLTGGEVVYHITEKVNTSAVTIK